MYSIREEEEQWMIWDGFRKSQRFKYFLCWQNAFPVKLSDTWSFSFWRQSRYWKQFARTEDFSCWLLPAKRIKIIFKNLPIIYCFSWVQHWVPECRKIMSSLVVHHTETLILLPSTHKTLLHPQIPTNTTQLQILLYRQKYFLCFCL